MRWQMKPGEFQSFEIQLASQNDATKWETLWEWQKKFVTPLGGVVSVYVKWVSEEMFSAANSVSKWLS